MRLNRPRTAVLSFVSLLLLHGIYQVAAVPIIEPPPPKRAGKPPTSSHAEKRHSTSAERYPLETLFPPDSWELSEPKIIESGQVTLLLNDYQVREDGTVKLTPCTVIFHEPTKKGTGKSKTVAAPPIVMRAPQGATLQFDPPLDLRRASFGRLVGGRLSGPITIYRPPTVNGHDTLEVKTRDIELTNRRLTTPHKVQFRYGKNWGHGQRLDIFLNNESTAGGNGNSGSNIYGIELLELGHVDKVHLVAPNSMQTSHSTPPQDVPIDITCQGPFKFDFVKQVATFEKDVDVLRSVADGASDQLYCSLLEVRFKSPPSQESTQGDARRIDNENKLSPSTQLHPHTLIAHGSPARVRSPSAEVEALAGKIKYDLSQRVLTFSDRHKVRLKQKQNTVEAAYIEYQPGENGALGSLHAKGPGWFRAARTEQNDSEQPDILQCQWQGEIILRPDGHQHVLSLVNGARLSAGSENTISADQLHCWFNEVKNSMNTTPVHPNNSSKPKRFQPDRILAMGNVQVQSPQLTSKTSQLEVWFTHQAAVPTSRTRQTDTALGLPGLNNHTQQTTTHENTSKFDVIGDLIRLQLRRVGHQTHVDRINISGNAIFSESKQSEPGPLALVVTGDSLSVEDATGKQGRASVIGNPATIRARGLTMSGKTVRLNRGQNRIWVDGPGWMTLPVGTLPSSSSTALQVPTQRETKKPQALAVIWNKGMVFDGKQVRFSQQVETRTDSMKIHSDALEVDLTHSVNLLQPSTTQDIGVRSLKFIGAITAENRTIGDGQLTQWDRLNVSDLSLALDSGNIQATGPGRVQTVRHGQVKNSLASLTANNDLDPLVQPTVKRPPSKTNPGWNYLETIFQAGMSGNIYQQQIEFTGRVRTIYGPVTSPQDRLDADSPEGCGKEGLLVHCDRMVVAQHNTDDRTTRDIELVAIGNTTIEGDAFTARADRLSYTSGKGLLVLEGNDAELWHQQVQNGVNSRSAARRILFWTQEKRLQVDDASFLDLSQP